MSIWHVLNKLTESKLEIEQVDSIERNATIGLVSLHLGTSVSTPTVFYKFEKEILPNINKLINDLAIDQIHEIDRQLIVQLSYLVHRSIYQGYIVKGIWPIKNLPTQEDCAFPGCCKKGTQKDHIWPKSLGGPYEVWNFQWLCDFHNRMKSNAPVFGFIPNEIFQKGLQSWLKKEGWIK